MVANNVVKLIFVQKNGFEIKVADRYIRVFDWNFDMVF